MAAGGFQTYKGTKTVGWWVSRSGLPEMLHLSDEEALNWLCYVARSIAAVLGLEK